ncbi:MAG: hypothetical protein IH957_08915 [Chloroflexi bacterium]|nr:hypothetical protein [Chloroflexota bacterium]
MSAVNELCLAIHQTLEALTAQESPRSVPFTDGLYFFFEKTEKSEHAPDGRIVRVGNHPRSRGGLVRRLRNHYASNKNSSVFRKSIGGALMRRDQRDHPCLAHWEKQDAPKCADCKPTERHVTAMLRSSFSFRVVAIPNMPERNVMEALLIATLSACPTCGPSKEWLGRFARSEIVQRCGLWNSQFVGGPQLDQEELARFTELAEASHSD